MVTIANKLHDKGHSVEIVTGENEGPNKKNVNSDIVIQSLSDENIVATGYSLYQYLSAQSPDILISTLEIPNILSSIIPNQNTKRIIRIANTNSKKERVGKHRLIPLLKQISYPFADSIVTVSDGVATDIKKIVGISDSDTITIYNPSFIPDAYQNEKLKPNHDFFSFQDDVVVGVGSLKNQKDFSTLIKSISLLEEKKLIILGEGPNREDLVNLVEDLGISDRVSMPGYVDDPYSYMRHADVFVLSSAWEGCPNVLIEAMSCGTPIVSTNCDSGPREILKSGIYGSLVPVGDEKKMAQAIKEETQHPMDPELLVSRAEDFSVEKVSNDYEALITRLMKLD